MAIEAAQKIEQAKEAEEAAKAAKIDVVLAEQGPTAIVVPATSQGAKVMPTAEQVTWA